MSFCRPIRSVYKIIAGDLKSCRILYVAQGKAADALAGFWTSIRRKKIDVLKEQLREIWIQSNKQAVEKVMLDWVKQTREL